MVWHTVYPLKLAVVIVAKAPYIFIQLFLMHFYYTWYAVLGADDYMVVQLGVGHECMWLLFIPSGDED